MEVWVPIVVALISAVGSFMGVYISNRKAATLIEYRIGQLEAKVEKHNSLIERTYKPHHDTGKEGSITWQSQEELLQPLS